jgi:hypothetical protein
LFLSADRGYSSKSLREFLACSGAGFNGTLARNLGNPFTYDQKMKEGDERTSVPTAGGKTMFIKQAILHGIQFSTFAYHDGNGKVMLSMSNEFHNYQWDLVLRQNADRKWHEKHQNKDIAFGNVLRWCFLPLLQGSSLSVGMIHLLAWAPVQPLTMAQSVCAGGFFQRFLSQTSRSIDHGTAIYNGDEEELQHNESLVFVKRFITKAGARLYQKEADKVGQQQHQHGRGGCDETKMNKDGEDDEDKAGNEEKKDDMMDHDDEDDMDQDFHDFDNAIDLSRLLDNSDEAYITEVAKNLDDMQYSDETVLAVLSELGATLSNDQSEV